MTCSNSGSNSKSIKESCLHKGGGRASETSAICVFFWHFFKQLLNEKCLIIRKPFRYRKLSFRNDKSYWKQLKINKTRMWTRLSEITNFLKLLFNFNKIEIVQIDLERRSDLGLFIIKKYPYKENLRKFISFCHKCVWMIKFVIHIELFNDKEIFKLLIELFDLRIM